jgi:RNA polymerase sigma factor (sigma-70 family)
MRRPQKSTAEQAHTLARRRRGRAALRNKPTPTSVLRGQPPAGHRAGPMDAERRVLAERYVPLADSVARWRCWYGREEFSDVQSDALWGLTQAALAFQPGRAHFAHYARIRIDGAIRRGRQLRSGLTRPQWESEQRSKIISLQFPAYRDDSAETILDCLAGPSPRNEELKDAMSRLPSRERLVVTLHFYWGLTDSEIGELLGCHQVHASRINRAGIEKLRAALMSA